MEIEQQQQQQQAWPEWVETWLKLPFYEKKCRIHEKKYTTIYCGTCKEDPICEICWRDKSKLHHCDDHPVIQVCSASKRSAIDVNDIGEYIDISEIQRYIINGLRIVFLNPQQGSNSSSRSSHPPNCHTCGRNLKNPDSHRQIPYKFCSIACKLIGCKEGDMKKRDNPEEILRRQPQLKGSKKGNPRRAPLN